MIVICCLKCKNYSLVYDNRMVCSICNHKSSKQEQLDLSWELDKKKYFPLQMENEELNKTYV